MKQYLIYCLTSPSNKKYYGQTCDLNARLRHHQSPRSRCTAIRAAIVKYGFHNFKLDIVKEGVTLEDANYWESYFILRDNTLYPNGYNLDAGGDNRTPCNETIEKIRTALKGRPLPPDVVEKMKLARTGVKRTPSAINSMRESKMGSKNPMFGATPWNKGLTASTSPIVKVIADKQVGRIVSDQTRKKISEKKKGSRLSEQTRANMRLGQLNRERKKYVFVSPSGQKVAVSNLSLFCAENGLSDKHMPSVATGKRKHHRGWTVYNQGIA